MHGRAYDDYRVGNGIEEAIKSYPMAFFGYADFKKKRVGFPLYIFKVVWHLALTTSAIFLILIL
jgi:hypothetical protein